MSTEDAQHYTNSMLWDLSYHNSGLISVFWQQNYKPQGFSEDFLRKIALDIALRQSQSPYLSDDTVRMLYDTIAENYYDMHQENYPETLETLRDGIEQKAASVAHYFDNRSPLTQEYMRVLLSGKELTPEIVYELDLRESLSAPLRAMQTRPNWSVTIPEEFLIPFAVANLSIDEGELVGDYDAMRTNAQHIVAAVQRQAEEAQDYECAAAIKNAGDTLISSMVDATRYKGIQNCDLLTVFSERMPPPSFVDKQLLPRREKGLG